jgi:hypothetical protein
MSTSTRQLLLDPRTSEGRSLTDHSNADLLAALEHAPAVARDTLAAPDEERFDAVLVYRSVAAIMVEALRRRTDHVFSRGVITLGELWEIGNPDAMMFNVTPDFEASLWENLGIELFAIGALAVHWDLWAQARELASHESPTSGEGWLRQGQVVSARTAGPTDSFPHLVVREIGRLDTNVTGEEARRAFAIFDLFSALVITEFGVKYGYYPNAAEFDAELVEPFVIDQLRSATSHARAHVLVGDEEKLRETLRDYDSKARVAAAYARRGGKDWKWRAFADARTWGFINEGHMIESWGG